MLGFAPDVAGIPLPSPCAFKVNVYSRDTLISQGFLIVGVASSGIKHKRIWEELGDNLGRLNKSIA